MRYARPAALLLCAALLLTTLLPLAGCARHETSGETVELWFLASSPEEPGDLSDPAVKSVRMEVGRNADKSTAAMKALLSGYGGFASPYRPGVQITGITYNGGSIIIDFNREYLEMTGAELSGAEACAVLTLCGIDGISSAGFTVEGERYMSGSTALMTASDVVTGDLSLKPVEREITLCFSDGNLSYVVSETRNIVLRENALLERYVIEELIKGPAGDGVVSTLPKDTRLLGVSSEGRICYVNFSEEFREIMEWPLARRIQTLFAVTDSLCAVEGVECVQYFAGGERLFETPMYANDSVIGRYVDDSIECTVYYPDDSGEGAVGVPSRISTLGGFDLIRLLSERLVTGLDGSGFLSSLPRGTRVGSTSLSGGVAHIDFSAEFLKNEPPEGVSRPLMENLIALTLAGSGEGVDAVTITVDGAPYQDGRLIYPDRSLIRE